jgi:hypothetical protein
MTPADKARALHTELQLKMDRLLDLDPYLIDLSLRENPVGARMGQTLKNKLDLLPFIREFGFRNILLGTLDYSMPDELEVDDDFMSYLRDNNIDMTSCFAFTDIGMSDPSGNFTPSPSMTKLQSYRVPNTLHEIYLGPTTMPYDFATLMRSLPLSIQWLMQNIRGDGGGPPRILINIVDGCDAFAGNLEQTLEVLQLLSTQPIEGISFEDDRGSFLPFQVGTYVQMARAFLPSPQFKILVHMHSGGGFENASVMEALAAGADGAWGGLPKRAAIIGHASLGELIANLVRVGNPNMQKYALGALLPYARGFQIVDEEEPVPEDLPIVGTNAYRLTLSFFQQQAGRFMDLPPEAIGGSYGYRVCPVVSDPPVLAGRLAEVLGGPASRFPETVLEQMVRLMRRDLRAGERIVYDDPVQLVALYQRAGGLP